MFKKHKALKAELESLRAQHRKTQEFITDILSWRAGEKALEAASGPNPYRSRSRLIAEIVEKYKGYAAWGNQLVQRIVDTRAAFALGRGVRAKPNAADADAEMVFIEQCLQSNDLSGQFAQQLGVEKELEGQILLKMEPRFDAGDLTGVRVVFVSWNDTQYEVLFENDGDRKPNGARWRDPASGRDVEIPGEQMVFLRFNAPANAREGIPTLSGLLPEAEDIDRALRDWRAINRYFASPTPYFRTDDAQNARDLYERISDPEINWRVGKVFAGPADFSLVGMDAAGVSSIQAEIETKIKILSGGTGVPVQFLGFPEFMTNRATAENTMEPVEAISMAERQSWLAGFAELFDKAIRLRNEYAPPSAAKLRPGAVAPHIPFVTSGQIQTLCELYLPAFQAGAIDHKTFLSMLPERDAVNTAQNAQSEDD